MTKTKKPNAGAFDCHAVITAIHRGASEPTAIATATGFESAYVATVLEALEARELVTRSRTGEVATTARAI